MKLIKTTIILNIIFQPKYSMAYFKPEIGIGYSYETSLFKNSCINSSKYDYDSSEIEREIKFYVLENEDDIDAHSSLFGKLSLGINIANVSLSTSVQKLLNADKHTIVISYIDVIKFPSVSIDDTLTYTQYGMLASKQDDKLKKQFCGSTFLKGAHLTALSALSIKIHFNSNLIKEKFNTKISTQILWKNFSKSIIDKALEEFKNDILFSIDYIKIGGSETKYKQVIQEIKDQKTCNLSNIKSCFNTFQKILNTIQNEFYFELDNGRYNPDKDIGPIPVDFVFSDYETYGFKDLSVQENKDYIQHEEEVYQRIIELTNEMEKQALIYLKGEEILNFLISIKKNSKKQDLIKENNEKIISNIEILNRFKESCLLNETQCLVLSDSFKKNLKSYISIIMEDL